MHEGNWVSQVYGRVLLLIHPHELDCAWGFPSQVWSKGMELNRVLCRLHVGSNTGSLSISVGDHHGMEAMYIPAYPRADSIVNDPFACHVPDLLPGDGI